MSSTWRRGTTLVGHPVVPSAIGSSGRYEAAIEYTDLRDSCSLPLWVRKAAIHLQLDRRVIVRRETSLATLDVIVQSVFAWSDGHR